MQLLIKQRVFSFTDTYDVYDENQNQRYFVKGELFSFGHKIHVFDQNDREVGSISEKIFKFFPTFDIYMNDRRVGSVNKKMTFFRPKYEIDCCGWKVEGDFMNWEYEVYYEGRTIIRITKKLFAWGDTYVIDYNNPDDEIMGLLLVIAIDAANCTKNKN